MYVFLFLLFAFYLTFFWFLRSKPSDIIFRVLCSLVGFSGQLTLTTRPSEIPIRLQPRFSAYQQDEDGTFSTTSSLTTWENKTKDTTSTW